MCARHLREDRKGSTCDPQQGLPDPRLRSSPHHRRHICSAGVARARPERAARASGRCSRTGCCGTAAGRGQRPGQAHRSGRPYRVRATGERSGAGRALARHHRAAVVRRGLPVPSARALLAAGIAAYAVGFAALSVLRHSAFITGRFDLGNMVQAVWSTAHGHLLRMTDLHGDQISRLAAHVDPILVLFTPLWWIWPSPNMLLVVQAVAIALGAVPVYLLASKHLGSGRAGAGFALAYLA